MRAFQLIGCLAALTAAAAQAQTSSTQCQPNYAGGFNCTSSNYADQDWGSLFQKVHDRHVQKKVGKMIAAGDCKGAFNYAVQESMELAQQVKDICTQR